MTGFEEPWYVVTHNSSAPKIIKFGVAMLTLAAGAGACLWDASVYPPVRFFIGIACASCILFVAYSQGVIAGASSMYTYLQDKARSVSSALAMMDEVLNKRKEDE